MTNARATRLGRPAYEQAPPRTLAPVTMRDWLTRSAASHVGTTIRNIEAVADQQGDTL